MKVFTSCFSTLILLLSMSASAQFVSSGNPVNQVGIDQKIGAQIPMNLSVRDETSRLIPIRSCFHNRPVILELVYYGCPMLCTQSLTGLQRSMNGIPESAGTEFDVVTVSFDPNETPALASEKKQSYLKGYPRLTASEGWRFFTADVETIRQLTSSVGFRYRFDVASNSFAHSSALIILTPSGRVSRYLFGVEYDSTELRQALVAAQKEQSGPIAEQVLLYCLRYNAATGRYSLVISRFVQLSAALTFLALATFISFQIARDRRRRGAAHA